MMNQTFFAQQDFDSFAAAKQLSHQLHNLRSEMALDRNHKHPNHIDNEYPIRFSLTHHRNKTQPSNRTNYTSLRALLRTLFSQIKCHSFCFLLLFQKVLIEPTKTLAIFILCRINKHKLKRETICLKKQLKCLILVKFYPPFQYLHI